MRVYLIMDDPLTCELLGLALKQTGDEVVGIARRAEAGLDEILRIQPDVVLSELLLGCGMNGIELGLEIKRIRPETGIVIFSDHLLPGYFRSMFQREPTSGWAYLLRRWTPDLSTLLQVMDSVARGLFVLDPQLKQAEDLPQHWGIALLTPRELEVLQLIARGYSNAAIATQLFVSTKSIEHHITNLYQKLNIGQDPNTHPRVQAARLYLECYGLPGPEEPRRSAD